MFPADRNHEPVSIEYDYRNSRFSKTFVDPHKAKQFYVSKFKLGKHPKVRSEIMAKSTKKTTAKKTTKKASAKKTAASGTKKSTKTTRSTNGLTGSEAKVLKALVKSNKPLTRGQLSTATGIKAGWAKLLGAATRDGLGTQGGGMAGKGLLKIEKHEGERQLTHTITAKGRTAIAKV